MARRYRVTAPGCVVREGLELDSPRVGELEPGVEVVVLDKDGNDEEVERRARNGTRRIRIVRPMRGWVSEKRLEAYGTSHAIPRKIKIGTKVPLRAYDTADPLEAWVRQHMPGRDPREPACAFGYAKSLSDGDEKRAYLVAVLKANPAHEGARRLLGELDEGRKKKAAAKAPRPDRETELKERADKAFNRRDWRSALTIYLALLGEPQRAVDGEVVTATPPASAKVRAKLRANASACLCKLKRWAEAERQATLAIAEDPEWPKARRRLAAALEGGGRLVAAATSLREAGLATAAIDRLARDAEARDMSRADAEARAAEEARREAELIELEDLAGTAEDTYALENAPPEIRESLGLDDDRAKRAAAKQFMREDPRDSESSLSDDDDSDSDDSDDGRLEAALAARRAKAAESKRVAAATLSRLVVAKENALDPEKATVCVEGNEARQTSARRAGAALCVRPLAAVDAWCFAMARRGEPCFGVCRAGADFTTSLASDPNAWTVVASTHATRLVARGHASDHELRALSAGDAVGLVFDSDSSKSGGRLDLYVNGTLRRAGVFSDLPSAERLFAFVGFEANSVEAGGCRFLSGVLDDPLRRETAAALAAFRGGKSKAFRLVEADGRPHPRVARHRKHPMKLREVHERGDGVPNAVWCETDQARWTQSVQKIEVVALRKPRDVPAIDCDVRISVRYLKAAHKVTGEVWLEGQLERDVLPDDSVWFVDDDGSLQFVLAKSLVAIHASAFVSDGNWLRLFDFDDKLSEDDVEDDRTDLDPDRKRVETLAHLKSSEQAKFEAAKRATVEHAGKSWTWVKTGDPSDPILPSYLVPDQIGYDVPCDRDLALKQAGYITGA